jgi:hypothetical protein
MKSLKKAAVFGRLMRKRRECLIGSDVKVRRVLQELRG